MPENLKTGGQMVSIFVPDELAELTPDLRRFWDAQVYKLRRNKHKGRWADLSVEDAMVGLMDEAGELQGAIGEGSSMEILMEAADVGNFALIVANVALEAPSSAHGAVTVPDRPAPVRRGKPPQKAKGA